MNDNIYQLYQQYNINGHDTNRIHHLCAANMKKEAIAHIQIKTKDYEIAKQIVEDYITDYADEINEQAEINQRCKQEEYRKILNPDVPKCPICGSANLSKISTLKKASKVGLFGIFGAGDIGKTWKCNNCGSKF